MSNAPYTSLIGVWRISNMPFDEDGLLVIRDDSRVIQFPTCQKRPRVNQTHRLWHADYDGDRIRFRPNPSAEGWFRGVEHTELGWDLVAIEEGERKVFPCVSADLTTLPIWFPEMIVKNLKEMETLEMQHQVEADAP